MKMAGEEQRPDKELLRQGGVEGQSASGAAIVGAQTAGEVADTLTSNMTKREKYSLARETRNPGILVKLAKDEDGDIKIGIAGNPNTPEDILKELAKDGDGDVRRWVAKNPSTPSYILEKLAEDEDIDGDIKIGVVRNPNTTIPILELLKKDDYPVVAILAQKRLKEMKK